MTKWINKADIEEQEARQIDKYGYVRWELAGRYGYYAIDEAPHPDTPEGKAGCILRVYDSVLKKKDAYNIINELLED